jgi:adenine-specific DNA-methyltransferase
MKYMGSKRSMLRNGLGDILNREVPKAKRFVDLFTGSAVVASHVAQNFDVEVLASDLQQYSVVLANAVISRSRSIDADRLWEKWIASAQEIVSAIKSVPAVGDRLTRQEVTEQRDWCAKQSRPITRAYGGHYFSATQAIWIDALRGSLPREAVKKNVSLAALIRAASHCAAGPGHTAQSFQPTATAKKFLLESWKRDLVGQTKKQLKELSLLRAHKIGRARKIDANVMALEVLKGDLVFIDPPYSGVHYSRFYHVLETVASGKPVDVTGIGRYPAYEERPRSSYSVQSESAEAFERLLQVISSKQASVIITFPDHDCSNGLSGERVLNLAKQHFSVRKKAVASRFSSLGGTSDNRGNEAGRSARVAASELILHLTPK